jgi:hypothetical protein
MLAINVVQMAMIEVIDMVLMANSGVATAWAVNVRTCASRLISAGHWGLVLGCVAPAQSQFHRVSEEQYSRMAILTPKPVFEFRLSWCSRRPPSFLSLTLHCRCARRGATCTGEPCEAAEAASNCPIANGCRLCSSLERLCGPVLART